MTPHGSGSLPGCGCRDSAWGKLSFSLGKPTPRLPLTLRAGSPRDDVAADLWAKHQGAGNSFGNRGPKTADITEGASVQTMAETLSGKTV